MEKRSQKGKTNAEINKKDRKFREFSVVFVTETRIFLLALVIL